MTRRYWTTTDLRKLQTLYPNMENVEVGAALGRSWSAVQNLAGKLGLRKSPEFLAKHCRFQNGHATWNAGKPWSPPASRATQFKTGHRGARQKPVGAERMERDSLMVKIAEPDVWKPKARVIWEQHFGVIQAGAVVRLKDGNKENCAPGNLLLISRQENARLNAVNRKPRRRLTSWVQPLRHGASA